MPACVFVSMSFSVSVPLSVSLATCRDHPLQAERQFSTDLARKSFFRRREVVDLQTVAHTKGSIKKNVQNQMNDLL